mgnify:CR=1 FL=1
MTDDLDPFESFDSEIIRSLRGIYMNPKGSALVAFVMKTSSLIYFVSRYLM